MPFDDGLPQDKEYPQEDEVHLRVFVTPLSAVNQQGGATVKIYDNCLGQTGEDDDAGFLDSTSEALFWGGERAAATRLPYAQPERDGVLRPVLRPTLWAEYLQHKGPRVILKMGFMAEQRLDNPGRKYKRSIPMSQPRLLAYLGGQPIPRATSPEPERDSDGEDW